MTNTPNNTAGEEWEKEFDEKFVRSKPLGTDFEINDYDVRNIRSAIKFFISKSIQSAITGERQKFVEKLKRRTSVRSAEEAKRRTEAKVILLTAPIVSDFSRNN